MKKASLIHLFISFLAVVFIFLIGVGCDPTNTPPVNNNDDNKDSWYTEGFTKANVDETDMLNDLFNSFSNQIKNASTIKVNQQSPQYSMDMGIRIKINNVPGRVEFKVNGDTENYVNRSLHLAIYKGEGSTENLFLQVNVLPINEEQSDLFISLKGPEGFTKITMKIFSEVLDNIFPMTLGSGFDTTMGSIGQVVGGALAFETEIKYEFKRAGNYCTRHYNVVIDLKTTLERLVDLIPTFSEFQGLREDLAFFFANLLGIDSTNEDTIEATMPPMEIEIDFTTQKGTYLSFTGEDAIISNLSINCVVSEDTSTQATNTRFKGERQEIELLWDKIIVRRNVLNEAMPGREELLIYDPLNPNTEAYKMYNHDGPLAILLKGVYEGDYVDEPMSMHFGFKYNYYQPDGSDDEFCFRVFNDLDQDVLSLYYKDNIAYFHGVSETDFSIPFDSSAFIMGNGGQNLLSEENLLFKIVTYLLGAVEMMGENEIIINVETEYLTNVLGITLESFQQALNDAYRGSGTLTQILEENQIDIADFLSNRKFVLTISLEEEFLEIFDNSLPDLEGLGEE